MHDEIKIIMLKKYPGAEWIDIKQYLQISNRKKNDPVLERIRSLPQISERTRSTS